jgi:hypothetical protein
MKYSVVVLQVIVEGAWQDIDMLPLLKWFTEANRMLKVADFPLASEAMLLWRAAVKFETRRVTFAVELRLPAVPVIVKG